MFTTPTFEYFVSRLNDDINRIGGGIGNTYDFYETTSHDKDFNINGHRVVLSFSLRIEVATRELVLHDRIVAKVDVALTMFEDENVRNEPSSRKMRSYVDATVRQSCSIYWS